MSDLKMLVIAEEDKLTVLADNLSKDQISRITAIATEPRPLLADARVGDLCKRRDGKWVQIDAIRNNGNKWSIYEAEGHSYHESGNSVCSELYHTNLDIIHTEPLAAEGTAEWAWQMLKLGNKVIAGNPDNPRERQNDPYWITENCVCYQNEKNITCKVDDFLEIFKDCTWVWQIYDPKPAYKVGDWVELTDGLQCCLVELLNPNSGHWLAKRVDGSEVSVWEKGSIRRIARTIPKSEVKVSITIEGTVKSCSVNTFELCTEQGSYWIGWKELDPDTRKLVEKLLKAQEESCHS